MAWPVGFGVARVAYATAADGTILADGAAVTERGGWVELPTAPELSGPGIPASYWLRLRIVPSSGRKAFFYAEEVDVGGVRHAGLFELAKQRGSEWLSAPVRAAREQVESRRRAALTAAAVVREGLAPRVAAIAGVQPA